MSMNLTASGLVSAAAVWGIYRVERRWRLRGAGLVGA